MDNITIVTVTHDARKFVKLCVEATNRRTPEAHDHVVIDNGSTDGTLQMLRKYRDSSIIKLYERRLRKNAAGHAISLNWFLYSVTPATKYVCLLDSDAYPVQEGWLTTLYERMIENNADGIGFSHFRNRDLLHPACMLFDYSKLVHAGKPDWRINKVKGTFNDTGMTACRAMVRYGAKLMPLSEEDMKDIVRHRWCATRIEIAKDGILDGHLTREDYDKESELFFSEDAARL